MPKKLQDREHGTRYIVDGGLLSNFPLWVFNNDSLQARPVIGFTLSDSLEQVQPKKINNALDMLQAIFLAMLQAHDARYISRSKQENIVFIPVKNVQTTDLSITTKEKNALIDLGNKETTQFLKNKIV